MKLVVATRNQHKLTEIRAILQDADVEIVDLSAYPDSKEVVEDRDTFEGNAGKKAQELMEHTGQWVLADDSGLEVDALNGEPGVYSARYAGEPVSDEANNRKLLSGMSGIESRAARFRCVIALASPSGDIWTVSGVCEGTIGLTPMGEEGFGYDPLFIPSGHSRTFAELPADEKNRISHRGRALQLAREQLFPKLAEVQ